MEAAVAGRTATKAKLAEMAKVCRVERAKAKKPRKRTMRMQTRMLQARSGRAPAHTKIVAAATAAAAAQEIVQPEVTGAKRVNPTEMNR